MAKRDKKTYQIFIHHAIKLEEPRDRMKKL